MSERFPAGLKLNEEQDVARRSDTWLSAEELRAHLAALIRLENVGVLLGSGASSGSLGGRTLKSLWEHYKSDSQASAKWLESKGFVGKDIVPDVEHLFDTLEIAAVEWKRLGWTRRVQELQVVIDDLKRAVIEATLLRREYWEGSAHPDCVSPELSNHRKFLQRLTAARQPGQGAPWIFTPNYDLAIEWAAESIGLRLTNGFEGLHTRSFSPQSFDLGYHNLLARGEARFGTYNLNLVKLHGSLSWQVSEDGEDYLEVPYRTAWAEIEPFMKKGKNATLRCPVIFPSAAKYMQTVGFVLGELMRRFTEFLSRPQTTLITCGYGFRDEHLDHLILRALQNPTLQLVVFVPEAKKDNGQWDVFRCSPWLKRIVGLQSSQVTLVGEEDNAYFDKLVAMLPDPAIYDEHAMQIRRTLRELSNKDE